MTWPSSRSLGIPNTWPVRVVRRGGYGNVVDLAIEGRLPAGVTMRFDPPSLGPGATATELSLTARSDMEEVDFDAILRARGEGVPDAACTVTIGVWYGAWGKEESLLGRCVLTDDCYLPRLLVEGRITD